MTRVSLLDRNSSTMTRVPPVSQGQVLRGSLFSEPMRVETVHVTGPASWVVGLPALGYTELPTEAQIGPAPFRPD